MRVTSHVRGDLRAAALVLVSVLGPRSLAGPASCPSPCSATSPPWLGLPPPSWPLKAPPAPGLSVLPSQPGGPEGRLWLLGGSPGSPVTRAHAGEGVRVAKAAVQTWVQGRGSSQSLGEFADDANQGCVLILEPLVVSAEVGQGL